MNMSLRVILACLCSAGIVSSFLLCPTSTGIRKKYFSALSFSKENGPNFETISETALSESTDIKIINSEAHFDKIFPSALSFMFLWLGPACDAMAKGGEYGIFEGRTVAMIHPVMMLMLFGLSVYTGTLGLGWKRLREAGSEIRELNAQLPVLSTGQASYPIAEKVQAIKIELASLKGVEDNDANLKSNILNADLQKLNAYLDYDVKISELTKLREDLQTKKLKERHFAVSSVLLGAGVTTSILGGLDTYFRAGKLFPGPHLFAGMGITALWALATALVPFMQKGNDNARNAHIALNTVNIGLFAWQVYTGLDIMIKVWGFTKWP